MHGRLKRYDRCVGSSWPEPHRYKESARENLSLPIPGEPPSKKVGTHCTAQQVKEGYYALAFYTDTSADFGLASPEIREEAFKAIEEQLRCKVVSEIHPQAQVQTYVRQARIKRLTPWVLEIKTTDKWGGDWLHNFSGPKCLTTEVDPSIRGPTSTLTEHMNLVSLPHPTERDGSGRTKMFKYAFTLALPALPSRGIRKGQEAGGMAREEKKTTPYAIYVTGLHMNCAPEKFMAEITKRVAEKDGHEFPALKKYSPPHMQT